MAREQRPKEERKGGGKESVGGREGEEGRAGVGEKMCYFRRKARVSKAQHLKYVYSQLSYEEAMPGKAQQSKLLQQPLLTPGTLLDITLVGRP